MEIRRHERTPCLLVPGWPFNLLHANSRHVAHRPFDPATGHLAGPATEFYRLEGFSSGGTLTNTLTANRDQIFMTVTRGSSDIWMTELP